MPPTNVIINGDFNNGSANWSGTDIEANYTEGAYLGNGSSNRVAEIDGNSGQTTVMEQTFTITDPSSGRLTLDTALRTASNSNAGQEGFVVEILDSGGNVIASMTVLPTTNSFQSISLDVNFPSAGDYTLRFTELGLDDSLGAIVDNIKLIVCFCQGTQIETEFGERPVETLRIGDMVMTQNGLKPLQWIGKRSLNATDLAIHPKLHPVRIGVGALGNGLPNRDLLVSRQHRMQTSSVVANRMFGTPDVLVSAIKLTELPGIEIDQGLESVTYYHLLFDAHEIIFANGAPSESLLLTDAALSSVTEEARAEIELLFPDRPRVNAPHSQLRIPHGKQQKRFVERLSKNNKPLLEFESA
ncbi:Hint domain-containing protein [Roseibium sp. RKSG952]|uniref:Hint domain-containing protein n=1 Tax=Roseibium sp. RKSG952 TaxID=2529384 RepID=UPI0012BC5022|nr:Hint domain-containing protein [Roseibium sp. RKSG952]MTI01839.1 hemolysin [Roseibium sp. RKSG952]